MFLLWLDLRLNPGLLGHWQTLYPLDQTCTQFNGLVSLFNRISTFVGNSILEEQQWYYKTYTGGKEIDSFSKGINPKVNVIALFEFELIYFEAEVPYFNYYIRLLLFHGFIFSRNNFQTSICHINGTLTGTTTPGKNDHKGVLHIC